MKTKYGWVNLIWYASVIGWALVLAQNYLQAVGPNADIIMSFNTFHEWLPEFLDLAFIALWGAKRAWGEMVAW